MTDHLHQKGHKELSLPVCVRLLLAITLNKALTILNTQCRNVRTGTQWRGETLSEPGSSALTGWGEFSPPYLDQLTV